MRRIWLVCLIVLLGGVWHDATAGAQEDTPDSSSSSQVEIVVVVPFAVHDFSVSCDGTVTIEYTTDEDRSVQLSSTVLSYDQEPIEAQEEIILAASSTMRTIELGDGYDAYQVSLLDTGLPNLPSAQVGNCNSAFAIDSLAVDCFGTATIAYTASGDAPRVRLTVSGDGTDPEPGDVHDLDPAETTATIPYVDLPSSWGGSTVISAHLEWLTHADVEERTASCEPDFDPTPTEPPVPIDVIVQIIIDIIQSVLDDMNA